MISFLAPNPPYHRLEPFGAEQGDCGPSREGKQRRSDFDTTRNPVRADVGGPRQYPAQTSHIGPSSLRHPQRDSTTREVSLPAGPAPA